MCILCVVYIINYLYLIGGVVMKRRVDIMLNESNINFLNDFAMYTLYSKSSIVDSLLTFIKNTMKPDQIKECVDMFKVDGRRK